MILLQEKLIASFACVHCVKQADIAVCVAVGSGEKWEFVELLV